METKTKEKKEVKKTKKDFILEFLAGVHPATKPEAFEGYNSCALTENKVSNAFFNKTWAEVKGFVPKEEKVSRNADAIRAQIGNMYREQEKLYEPVRIAHTKALITNDEAEKKTLLEVADKAFDKVTAFNRTIRDFMEKNSLNYKAPVIKEN